MLSVRQSVLAALFAGLLHALSFAPVTTWWLQLLAFAALVVLISWHPGRAGTITWIFGVASFSAGLSWMFISMNHFGRMPAPLAATAVVLLSAYLAAYAAVATRLAVKWSNGSLAAGRFGRFILLLAGLLGISELAKGLLLTGFPWLSVGYAHVDGPLSAFAPFVGVYGVGMAAILLSALLACGLLSMLRRAPGTRIAGFFAAAALLLILAAGSGQVTFVEAREQAVRVRLLQGNVEQQLKFDPQRAARAMREYIDMVTAGAEQLYVLPETAWTTSLARTPPVLLTRLTRHLQQTGGVFATGIPLRQRDDRARYGVVPTNSVLAIDPESTITARYDKRHLVPFGEFVPPGFQWFIDLMQVPLGNFGRGSASQPLLQLAGTGVAFNICYEDLFGEELAVQVRQGANILINVSNIGWFGRSHALAQHLNISRMRAMELGRPMLRATNTGVTAHIDHRGRILGQLPVYEAGSLVAETRPASGMTPFARFGLLLPAALALVLIVAAAFASRLRAGDADAQNQRVA